MAKRSRAKQDGESKAPSRKRQRTDGEVTSYDLTHWGQEEPLIVAKALRALAKRWVFQREESKDKKAHYQIRMSLYHKKSMEGLKTLLKDTVLEKAHISKTAGVNSKSFNYVMKKDSRIDGPWEDNDPDPDQVDKEVFYEDTPWQKAILDEIKKEPHSRQVLVVIDPIGRCGKTNLISKIRYRKLGTIVPGTMEVAADMSAMIMCKPADRCYVIDLPRAITPKKMLSFWSGIEGIKNGYCCDKRITFRDRVFKKPHVIVFTNKEPPMEMMSEDRWNIIRLQPSDRMPQAI